MNHKVKDQKRQKKTKKRPEKTQKKSKDISEKREMKECVSLRLESVWLGQPYQELKLQPVQLARSSEPTSSPTTARYNPRVGCRRKKSVDPHNLRTCQPCQITALKFVVIRQYLSIWSPHKSTIHHDIHSFHMDRGETMPCQTRVEIEYKRQRSRVKIIFHNIIISESKGYQRFPIVTVCTQLVHPYTHTHTHTSCRILGIKQDRWFNDRSVEN